MGLKRGRFVTFEGVEGSGKSTQIARAAAFLRRRGRKVSVFREPGSTRVGEAIRAVILARAHAGMRPETEMLLYLAARAQIVREKIEPALRRGEVVICDRFEDSTLAYQGFGRGLDRRKIEQVSRLFVRGGLKPDRTFLLDIDPRRGMKRGGRRDRMEREAFRFHERVRRGFLALRRRDPKRFVRIDARRTIAQVASEIRRELERAF